MGVLQQLMLSQKISSGSGNSTITVVQSGGTLTDNAATGSRAFASDVTSGNKLAIISWRFAVTDSGAFVAGDCTKSSGTATIGTVSNPVTTNVAYDGTNYVQVGLWFVDVTGSGTLTMQVAWASGSYGAVVGIEMSSSGGWDGTYLEDTITNQTSSDGTNVASGNVDLAGRGIMIGVMSTTNNGGVSTITPNPNDGTWTEVLEEQNEDLHGIGAVMYRINSSASPLSDSFDWTLSGNLGWAVAGVALKGA